MRNYGRRTILAPFTEAQLLDTDEESVKNTITYIIDNYYEVYHPANREEIIYLKKYKKGEQDILGKTKYTRPEINNKIVENWAMAHINFKTAFILGEAVQYTQTDLKVNPEISSLNNYVKYQNKNVKDKLIYDDILTCGRGYRYTNKNPKFDENSSPFEILNCAVEHTEVIYSSELGNEQLLSIIETPMIDTTSPEQTPYSKYDVYTRNAHYVLDNKNSDYKFICEKLDIIYNDHLIKEWYINTERLSLIELGKDSYDLINKIESLDVDDMEQIVNSIMVFTNAEVDEETISRIKDLGAVSIKSTSDMPASVGTLKEELSSTETESMYNRVLNSLHQIVAVPLANNNGSISTGDTGKATYTGQGFTNATIAIKNDENMLKMCDMNSLMTILRVCRETSGSEIKYLRTIDVYNKFLIDKSENLLTKTQGLSNLLSCGVPEEFAVPTVNLFADSNAVVDAMLEQEKENQIKAEAISSTNEQNNVITNTEQIDIQEQ